jgi:hypothetical protein
MTSCLSDMRTVCPQGLTFRSRSLIGVRVSYLRMHPSLCNGLNQLPDIIVLSHHDDQTTTTKYVIGETIG